MARITYHDRFADLLAKDYLSSRDRTFAESLYSSYKRKKALTTGRRRCFLQLEERYAVKPQENQAMVARLDALRVRMNGGGGTWAQDFTASLLGQAKSGRDFSERQGEILKDIESRWTNEEVQGRVSWKQTFTPDMRERYRIMVEYYSVTGYYARAVNAYRLDNEMIPSKEDYERLTKNKYAAKILGGWYAMAKFDVGSMIAASAGATWKTRSAMGASRLGVVISVNATVPTAAARGNKVYKILPVGGAQVVICEERELKKARVSSKTKAKKSKEKGAA